ncbi:MAG: flippase-like domain-containing protein [Magnetovibrio sp.]|nr:flippase-like domain-containing protein [Magnetovibrio sp.]
MTSNTRRHLFLALKLVISVVLVGMLLQSVGAEDAFLRMIEIDPLWLMASIGFGFAQMVLGTFRWQLVLKSIKAKMSWVQLLRFNFIGGFFNQTLPSSVGGDAVRGFMAYRAGLGVGAAVNSILLDRIATVIGLVLLVAVMTFMHGATLEGGEWFTSSVMSVVLVALCGLVVLMVMDRMPTRIRHFRMIEGISALAVDARRTFLHPLYSPALISVCVMGHINMTMIIYMLALGLGVDVSLSNCLLLFPPVLLIQTIPISVAGWGVREGAMVTLFALAGIGGESVLAISILFGLVMIVISLPGVILWLISGRNTLKQAEAFAER